MIPYFYMAVGFILISAILWAMWMRSDTQENRKYTVHATGFTLLLQILSALGVIVEGNFMS